MCAWRVNASVAIEIHWLHNRIHHPYSFARILRKDMELHIVRFSMCLPHRAMQNLYVCDSSEKHAWIGTEEWERGTYEKNNVHTTKTLKSNWPNCFIYTPVFVMFAYLGGILTNDIFKLHGLHSKDHITLIISINKWIGLVSFTLNVTQFAKWKISYNVRFICVYVLNSAEYTIKRNMQKIL